MDNANILNLILAHACVSDTSQEETRCFTLNLCCYDVQLKAKVLSEPGEWPVRYEVLEVKTVGAGNKACGCPTCVSLRGETVDADFD